MSQQPQLPPRLRRSNHLSWFAHMGAVYLFHDQIGYLMEMSSDVADFIEAFGGGADTMAVCQKFAERFDDADPRQFVDVLMQHGVLIEPDEEEPIWPYVAIKGKWNVWRRRNGRLTLYTAWGERPVTQLMLDEDETAMWDAFDGEKRLGELRAKFDEHKLAHLVRRLVHSDVQAIKLSIMPWSQYAKRPAMAPPYLTSTMPYPKWQPGTPVPPAADLTHYHQQITGANEQFDHQETTLSHLLRVPHPTLGHKTYGAKLVDAFTGKLPAGKVRVLETGAGLGYVARDVIARLKELDRTVEYTIVELSPALADAQQKLIGNAATWMIGDALSAKIDGEFDLILSNEMVGDLPAVQAKRADIGLGPDSGEADREKLRTLSALAADHVNVDDAPEPFYLQTGAMSLVAKLAKHLAPQGVLVVTEFGDRAKWPVVSTHLDHPELSTHFGHLQQVAKGVGLDAKIEFIIDLLDFDRDLKGLATTRSHFRALHALFGDAGIELAKIGYTPELLEALAGGKLDLATVGELRYDRIEDRLMGLVPHEFKALVATRP